MTENHQLGSYEDQIKLLEDELYMAEKNKKMFYRLWIKWANECIDIEKSINRINKKHPTLM